MTGIQVMPGFCLAYAKDGLGDIRNRLASSMFSGSRNGLAFTWDVLASSEKTILGLNRHKDQATLIHEDERFLAIVDGLVYEKTEHQVLGEMERLSRAVFIGGMSVEDLARKWSLGTDGEFAVILIDKDTDDLVVFNDRLGRFPVYYSMRPGRVVVCRNPFHIVDVFGECHYDKNAVFEYVQFGYPLGEKTVIDGIHQFRGCSCLISDRSSGIPVVKNLFQYNFDDRPEGSAGMTEHADNIIGLLKEACSARIDDSYRSVLALSGGLDSRTVGICLKDLGVDFSATTFCDKYGMVDPDIEFAGRIADTLEIEQDMTYLPKASGGDVLDLLKIKCGMNYLGVSFSIPMIHDIMKKHGNRITLFTGDGGDRILRDTTPVMNLSGMDELVDYIVKTNSIFGMEVASRISGRDSNDLRSDLGDLLSSYPEQSMDGKYLHFIFYERCLKWHFSGEDRNRIFVRHVAPFYASRVFEYCMRIPGRFKKDFKLYREVLTRLSPAVAGIPNPEWNFPITSGKLSLYCLARRIYFHMPEMVKKLIQRKHCYSKVAGVYDHDTPVMRSFQSQLENNTAVRRHLSVEGIRENLGRMDKTGFDHLFTLTSIMELTDCGRSSIEPYSATEFL